MIPKLDTVPEGKTEQSKLGGQWTFPFIQMANAVIVKSIMPNRTTLNYSNSAMISILGQFIKVSSSICLYFSFSNFFWKTAISHHLDSKEYLHYKCKLTPTEFKITDFLEACIRMLALHFVFIFKSCLWMYSDGVSKAIPIWLCLRPVKIVPKNYWNSLMYILLILYSMTIWLSISTIIN